MKPEQFASRLGNIDDALVEQAAQPQNFGRAQRRRRVRRILSVAAMLVLLAGSFAVGSLTAAANADPIYIEKTQELIVVGDSGITLVLPESWAGKYGYEVDGENIAVYHRATHEDSSSDWQGAGYLFWINCVEELYPLDYSYPAPGYTIATTDTHTYMLIRASDVQYDPQNEALAAEYLALSAGIQDIQILLTDWMRQHSSNAENWQEGTVYLKYLHNGEVLSTVTCTESQSQRIAELIAAQDFSLEQGGFASDLLIMVNGQEYFLNTSTGSIENAAGYPYSAILPAADLAELLALIQQ